MKICRRFHIKTPFTLWDTRTWDMWKICLQTFRNNRIYQKIVYFLRTLQNLRVNNSRILRIKNVKFSGSSFYMNTNIQGDFQICISVPLIISQQEKNYKPNIFGIFLYRGIYLGHEVIIKYPSKHIYVQRPTQKYKNNVRWCCSSAFTVDFKQILSIGMLKKLPLTHFCPVLCFSKIPVIFLQSNTNDWFLYET